MKFKAEKDIDQGLGRWIVSVDGEEWQEIVKKAERKAEKEIEIPGFRKGKVPAKLIKQHLTDAKILNVAHRLIVNKAYQYAYDQKSEIQPFSSPSPSVRKLSRDEYVLEIEFDLRPEIDIKKYVGFDELEKKEIKVDKKTIDQQIEEIRKRFAIKKDKTGPIAKGDEVEFDFEGFIDNKPFKGGKATGARLEIGSGQFIPGFEEAMIGFKAGEKPEIKVTFPTDYHVEDLKGKEATFKLDIKRVTESELPEINDELAKDVNLEGIDTLAKLKDYIKKNIHEQLKKQEIDRFVGELFRVIAKDSNISIPESIIKKEATKLRHEFEKRIEQQNVDIKTYKKKTGLREEDINNELFIDAKSRLENGIIVDKVKQEQKFDITDVDIDKQYDVLGRQFGIEGKKLKELDMIKIEQIKEQIIHDKIFEFLYENNGKLVTKSKK